MPGTSKVPGTCYAYSMLQDTFQPIQRAALTLMAGTLLVNAASFAKSLLIAKYYGTSAELDAYFLALAPGDVIAGILLGAIQAALIPRYLELTRQKGPPYAFAVFLSFAGYTLVLVMLLAGIFLFGSATIAAYLGPGFAPAQIRFTAALLRLSTIVLALNLLNDIGRYLFNAHRQFTLPAFIPLVGGCGALAYLAAFQADGVMALMDGLIFGMAAQTAVVLYAARRFRPARVLLFSPFHAEIRQTLKLMMPLLLGASLGYVNVLIDQIMASTLPAGSIAALNYASKLHNIFTQLLITVVSQAVFPFLAQQAANNDLPAVKATFLLTVRRILALLLPISFLILLMGKPLVRLAFQRGAFSAAATAATANAWKAYTLGLPAQALRHLTVIVYNALQENQTLMYVAGGSIGLNIGLNWLLMKIWGPTGIALSTSAVYFITTGVLLYRLRKKWQQQ